MCFMLMAAFIAASVSFYSQGMMPHAIISAVLATLALTFFIRTIYLKRRCIFGKDTDCNIVKPKESK